MELTNDCYQILIGTKNFTERYYRDKSGWLKISARGREFRMTAEQVLNHLLPAVASIKPNIILKVIHRDAPKSRSVQKQTAAKKVKKSDSIAVRPTRSGRRKPSP